MIIGITVALCLLGCGLFAIPVVGIVAAIAIPNFVAMQMKAKRAEVPGNVDALKTAELAYDAAYDRYVPFGDEAEARNSVGKQPRDWVDDEGTLLLGWRPDGQVRGAYWAEVDGNSFTVHGICDADGDGEFAEYVATESTNATLVTSPHVY